MNFSDQYVKIKKCGYVGDTFRNRVMRCIRVPVFLLDDSGESKLSAQTSPTIQCSRKGIHNQLVTGMVKTPDKIINHHPITESVYILRLSFLLLKKIKEGKKLNIIRVVDLT